MFLIALMGSPWLLLIEAVSQIPSPEATIAAIGLGGSVEILSVRHILLPGQALLVRLVPQSETLWCLNFPIICFHNVPRVAASVPSVRADPTPMRSP